LSVWTCILLTACSSVPQTVIQVVKIKPDPAWMANCQIPIRYGETLGSYYDWSFELWTSLEECNAAQEAERLFYLDD
jgi:hypothetical protein